MKNIDINPDYLNDGSFKELEKKYKLALKSKDANAKLEAFTNLGSIYCETKRYEESETNLLKALSLISGKKNDPRLSLIYKNLGLVNLKLFKLDKAEKYFKNALSLTSKKNKRVLSFIFDSLGDVYTKSMRSKEGLEYYNKALELRKELEFSKGISETLNKIGVNYYNQSDYEKAFTYVKESLKIREERNEKKDSVAACINNMSLIYYHKGEYQKALEYGLRALKLYEETNNIESQGLVFNNLGLIYFEISLFTEALECQFKALKIKEVLSNRSAVANTISNIGMIFTRLFNLDKALEYSERALKLRQEANDIKGIAHSFNDLGRIYDKMNDFDKAISYLNESIRMKRELNMVSGLAISLENLGMIYFKQLKYAESEKCLFEAKKICEEINEKKSIASINRNIGSLFLSQGKYEEALVYIKRSYDIAKNLNLKDKLRDSYKLFSEIYGKKNNFKKALAYYVLYSKTNEEILNLQKQNELNNISVKYENDKKDKENEINKLKNIELVKVNKELRKSRSDLLKSNSAKDKFFNIIAHDLKNPFSILYTTSELLQTYFDELNFKKQKEYINTINASTKHLLKLLENLLEWSRSQSGLRQFVRSEFEFAGSLQNCIDLIKPSADLKQISISLSIEQGIVISADKNMIKTVIRNLISNAVKFTKQGGEISIEAKITGNKLKFSVKDNGTGIKKKDLSKLFVIDKHFVSNGTANEKGTGIGLLLCKEFIEKHKGKMFVESRYRAGSVFGFEIPLK